MDNANVSWWDNDPRIKKAMELLPQGRQLHPSLSHYFRHQLYRAIEWAECRNSETVRNGTFPCVWCDERLRPEGCICCKAIRIEGMGITQYLIGCGMEPLPTSDYPFQNDMPELDPVVIMHNKARESEHARLNFEGAD